MDEDTHEDKRSADAAHEALANSLGLVGSSRVMERLRASIRRYAPLDAAVLVMGESGSGKELVARALHDTSRRRAGPFVAVNAAAIPSSLIASELFGHVRGAFTGAAGEHRGVFQQAHGGTLFLDEVAELPLDLQAWLLRTLETGELRPLGAERARRVDVRVVCATHVEVERAVSDGRFRADLYWRLAVLELKVPPLRERKGDLPELAAHLLAGLGLDERYALGPDAAQTLAVHEWPGNVRELRAVLLRAAVGSTRVRLGAEDIMRGIGRSFRGPDRENAAALASALRASGGNISAAARLLGLPRSTLRDRLRTRQSTTLN